MRELAIRKYIRYLFGLTIFMFFLNKFFLRPWVLDSDLPQPFHIIVLSIPNLIEAMVGVFILTGILFQMKQWFSMKIGSLKDVNVHVAAVGIAAVYVISQELKFHNLGGNNVYDIYDLIASIVGLLLAFGLIQTFGFIDNSNEEISQR